MSKKKRKKQMKWYVKIILCIIGIAISICLDEIAYVYLVDFYDEVVDFSNILAVFCMYGIVVFSINYLSQKHHDKKKFYQGSQNWKLWAYPVMQIISLVIFWVLVFYRDRFIHIDNEIVEKIIFYFLWILLYMGLYYAIGVSIADLMYIYEKRKSKKKNIDLSNCKKYTIEEITCLVENNDIIDVQIIFDGTVIEIGSSSDYEIDSAEFFDKLYYIGDKEFADIEAFNKALLPYMTNNRILVVSID